MGKRKTTHYTPEFKQSSAKLAVTGEKSISQTAKELGLHVSTLHGWVKQYYPNKASHEGESESDEIKCLRKEVARLKQERDILKKAAAYFASETV